MKAKRIVNQDVEVCERMQRRRLYSKLGGLEGTEARMLLDCELVGT